MRSSCQIGYNYDLLISELNRKLIHHSRIPSSFGLYSVSCSKGFLPDNSLVDSD